MERERAVEADVGYVAFFRTGEGAKGEFHCSGCGYGVTIFRRLPRCPMCGGQTWEQSAWSPFRAGVPPETRAGL